MKTLWQKIYSFFGFWTYKKCVGDDKAYLVIYWCLFPFFYFRKVDLFEIDISKTDSVNATKKSLMELLKSKGKTPEDFGIPSWTLNLPNE